jgi:hypothetical protein
MVGHADAELPRDRQDTGSRPAAGCLRVCRVYARWRWRGRPTIVTSGPAARGQGQGPGPEAAKFGGWQFIATLNRRPEPRVFSPGRGGERLADAGVDYHVVPRINHTGRGRSTWFSVCYPWFGARPATMAKEEALQLSSLSAYLAASSRALALMEWPPQVPAPPVGAFLARRVPRVACQPSVPWRSVFLGSIGTVAMRSGCCLLCLAVVLRGSKAAAILGVLLHSAQVSRNGAFSLS